MKMQLDISPDIEAWLEIQASVSAMSKEAFLQKVLERVSTRTEEDFVSAGSVTSTKVLTPEHLFDWT